MTSSGLKDDAATQPNFRSAYYEKVGFRGVDERKALQVILGQNPINIEKLATFILKCSNLAEASRLFVWKLLLGVLNNCASDRDYWWNWKVQCFHDCHRAVELITTCDTIGSIVGRAESLTMLWIALSEGSKQQLTDPEPKRFMSIVKYVLTLCADCEDAEAFYLSRNLCSRLTLTDEAMADYESIYLKILAQQKDLYNMCDRIGLNRLNEALPLRKWISRGMTGIFRSSKLLAKVMDKVVAGSVKVLVFVALSLVDVSRKKIADSDDAFDAVAKISSIETEEMEAKIITLALERWAKDQQRASSNTHHTDITFDSVPSRSFLGVGLQIRDNYAKPNFSLSNKIVVDDEDEL